MMGERMGLVGVNSQVPRRIRISTTPHNMSCLVDILVRLHFALVASPASRQPSRLARPLPANRSPRAWSQRRTPRCSSPTAVRSTTTRDYGPIRSPESGRIAD